MNGQRSMRPMAFALEMFFDGASEKAVCEIWTSLRAPGTSHAVDRGSVPHISLAVADEIELPGVISVVNEFARSTDALGIELSSVGIFPSAKPVVFLAPKVSAALLKLQERFWTALAPYMRGAWEHYAPGGWVPHCTLVEGYLPESLVDKLGRFLPLRATISSFGVVSFSAGSIVHLHRAGCVTSNPAKACHQLGR